LKMSSNTVVLYVFASADRQKTQNNLRTCNIQSQSVQQTITTILLSKVVIYLTQRINLANIQKSKLFINASEKVYAVSLLVCEINVAAMMFQKDEVLRRHPNDFSL